MSEDNTVLVQKYYLRELIDDSDVLAALIECGVQETDVWEQAQELLADIAVEQELEG